MSNNFFKDPDAILDYTQSWADWLTDTAGSATIVAVTAFSDKSGITVGAPTTDGTTITLRLTGGTIADQQYLITVRATLSDGEKDDMSFLVIMRQN